MVTTPAEGVGLDMRDMKTRIVFCVLNTMYPHEYKTLASFKVVGRKVLGLRILVTT